MKIDARPTQGGIFLRTSLWYGPYRSGKSHLCATFPRVAWFGAPREEGYITIQNMDPQNWYEPSRPPELYTVTSREELIGHLNKDVLPKVTRGEIQTIVFELSIYSDDLIRARAHENSWHKYQDLEAHLIHWDEAFKKVPNLRICYNALAASEDDPHKPGGILMAG